MPRAFVALGSNIDPEENIRAAVIALARHVRIAAISTVYLTGPEGRPGQPPFYNAVVEIETDRSPEELKFQVLRRIEADLGRERTADTYAPRTIDLDLVLHGDLVPHADGLELPDPRIADRPFLAIPLSELAPDLELPGTGLRMEDLAARLPRDGMQPLPEYTARLRIPSS